MLLSVLARKVVSDSCHDHFKHEIRILSHTWKKEILMAPKSPKMALSHGTEQHPDRYNRMQCWCQCLGERWWVSITQITTITCNAVVSACEKDGEWAWWHEDKMTRWQDDKITRWQDDKVTYDDKVTRWQDEKMTRWAKTFKNAAFFKVFDITTSESIANYNIKRLSRTPKNGQKNEI